MDSDSSTLRSFIHTALGGTFDHLHYGHKVMLSVGCLLTSDKLTIGVTGILFTN